jgi:hypothetical protein
MRLKKLLKVTAALGAALVILLLLFIAAFVFNPFEGSLPVIRDVVPRNVDFFLRKERLTEDLAEFPEPVFWQEFSDSSTWRQLKALPIGKQFMGTGAQKAIEDLRRLAQDLEQSWLDVTDDVLGREALVAGRLKGARLEDSAWCAYLRIGWRVRAAWGLASYAFVQEEMRKQGLSLRADGDLYEVTPSGQPPIWAARYRDCLMLGNDRSLVAESYDLARGVGGGDAFGQTATYLDGVIGRLDEWRKLTGAESVNALEFHIRPDQILQRTSWDDGWPDANHPTDMNTRVLARFVNLLGWQFLSGAVAFEPESISLLATVALNRNLHSPFQGRFFKAEEQARSEWLDPFLRLAPYDACAIAGLRMPAGEFVREMFTSLSASEQSLLNDQLRRTGQFAGALELIDKIEPALLPRTGFVFRKNKPDPQIPVQAASPVPQIAWVFWVREGHKRVLDDVLQFVRMHATTLGFSKSYVLPMPVGGDQIFEFTNPQIPGTGMVAAIVFDRYFVFGNSGTLIRDMFSAKLERGTRPITTSRDLQAFLPQVARTVNGFVFVQGREFEELLLDYDRFAAQLGQDLDPGWAKERRPQVEADVFRRKYSQHARTIATLDKDKLEEFHREVDGVLREAWKREGSAVSAEARESIQEAIAFCRAFSSLYLQVVLDPQSIKLVARARIAYR